MRFVRHLWLLLISVAVLPGCMALHGVGDPPDESVGRMSMGLHLGAIPTPRNLDVAMTLTTSTSLMRGARLGVGQLRADMNMGLGLGLVTGNGYVTFAPTVGVDLFGWSPVAWQIELGVTARTILGDEMDFGIGAVAATGWLIRFGDPRKQLRFYVSLEAMGYIQATYNKRNQQHFGGGLGFSYEAPF